jgi:F-type H+-transporting ATPase subunit b
MHLDWSTLILQTINVLVLLWLLRRFLFRPVAAIIAERRDAAEKLLAEAATARQEAQAGAEQAALHEKALAADSDRILAEARATAAKERAELLQRSKDEAAQARDAAQVTLEQQRDAMRRELEVEARHLAVTIAARLLDRVPPEALNSALLQSLDAWLTTLLPSELNSLAGPGEALEVVTAAALDPATQATCADMLRKRFGDLPAPRFGIDPSLIAGIELRGSHARLQNNWRADLDRIAEELGQDDKHLVMA